MTAGDPPALSAASPHRYLQLYLQLVSILLRHLVLSLPVTWLESGRLEGLSEKIGNWSQLGSAFHVPQPGSTIGKPCRAKSYTDICGLRLLIAVLSDLMIEALLFLSYAPHSSQV